MVAGSRPGSSSQRAVRKVSTAKRECGICGELLSAYNPGPNCFVHSTSASRRPESWQRR